MVRVWTLIGTFFSLLPGNIVAIASFAFSGLCILGLLRWVK